MSLIEKNPSAPKRPACTRRIINPRSGPLSDPQAARDRARQDEERRQASETLEMRDDLELNPDPIVFDSRLTNASDPSWEAEETAHFPQELSKRGQNRKEALNSDFDENGSTETLFAHSEQDAATNPARSDKPLARALAEAESQKKAQAQGLFAPHSASVAFRFGLSYPPPGSQSVASGSVIPPASIAPDPAPAHPISPPVEPLANPVMAAETSAAPLPAQTLQGRRLARPARVAVAARNSVIGMALAYLERLESLFSPVFFLGRNFASVAMALLHLAVPFAAAWFLSRWNPAVESRFWSGGVFEQAANFVGLWVLCLFGWTLICLVGSSVARGMGSSLRQFQSEGEKFFGPK